MRILYLSARLPYPADNGSKIRISNILTQLSMRHDVALLSFADRVEALDQSCRENLSQWCSSVAVLPWPEVRRSTRDLVPTLLSRRPRFFLERHSPAMHAAAARIVAERGCDLIIASELDMVPYALSVPGPTALLEDLEVAHYTTRSGGTAGCRRGRARSSPWRSSPPTCGRRCRDSPPAPSSPSWSGRTSDR